MTDVVQPATPAPFDASERSRTGLSAHALQRGIVDHLRYSIGRPSAALTPEHFYRATALAVRDRMQDNRVASSQTSLDLGRKVTCYLSAEFLMGPQLGSNLLNLGIEDEVRKVLEGIGVGYDEVLACEEEPGLGNGASAGSPRAISTHWPPSNGPPSATESAMSSASSTRRSTTAGRWRRPTIGWPTAIRGRSPSPT
jgi:starch phosphorylase